MKVVVIGGAGFIGFHTVSLLANKGYSVTVVDNFSRASVSRELRDLGIKVEKIDVRDINALHDVLRGTDYVIHLAALISVEESQRKPTLYHDVNITGTLNVLYASWRNNVEKVVLASSAAVYGEPIKLPILEDHPTKPISFYGLTKLVGEKYARYFSGRGLKVVVLRYFNVYGEYQSPSYAGVITNFILNAIHRRPLTIFGDGFQTRDFIYVGDVAKANLLALEKDTGTFNILNIASGKAVSIRDLAELILDIRGENLQIIYTKPREGDIRHSVADIRNANTTLGFYPQVELREGLSRTYNWFLKNLEKI